MPGRAILPVSLTEGEHWEDRSSSATRLDVERGVGWLGWEETLQRQPCGLTATASHRCSKRSPKKVAIKGAYSGEEGGLTW